MGNLKSVFNVFRRKTSLDAPGCRKSAASFFLFFRGERGGGELKNSFEISYHDIRGFKSCN